MAARMGLLLGPFWVIVGLLLTVVHPIFLLLALGGIGTLVWCLHLRKMDRDG